MILPEPSTKRTWVTLLRTHRQVLASVEDALKSAGLPPLAWYDVLLELERSKGQGIRPFELQKKLLLPQYGMSRLLDRIEKVALISRKPCDDDGRGQQLSITKRGVDMRKNMWRIYGPAIQSAVGEKLSLTEGKELSELLEKLQE